MLSICTVNVTIVSYPTLSTEIYEIGFLDLFFLDLFLGPCATFLTGLLKCRGGLWEKISLPHESCIVTNIR